MPHRSRNVHGKFLSLWPPRSRNYQNVAAYGVFRGTHTGEGGPVPPTGKQIEADYVYVMNFDGDKIRHMTKIWNDGFSLKQLEWV